LLFKDKTAYPTTHPNVPFELACNNRHIEIVKLLLQDKRIDLDPSCGLFFACNHSHLEIVKLLLQDKRVQPSNVSFEAAISKCHIKIVKLFLEDKRFDPSTNNQSAMKLAKRCGI
jgi:ankyrin repeat protein